MTEFQTQQDRDEHIAYLHGTRLALPERLSNYYKTGLTGSWVKDGWAVFVNAIPYRSPKLSAEPANRATAKCLTSLLVHRRWLLEEAVPAAQRGEKTIFVHRNGWWQLAQELASERIIFSDAMRAEPNRSAPDREKLLHTGYWLRSRMQQ